MTKLTKRCEAYLSKIMDQITLTFTVGQLFAVVGAICLIAITIALVIFLSRASKTAKEAQALMEDAREVLDDIQETKLAVVGAISKVQKALNVVEWVKKRKNKE